MKETTRSGTSERASVAGDAPRDTAVQATRLLGKWMRVARGHVPLGARCSCGMAAGAGNIMVQDFEVQILDYLFGKHGGGAADPALSLLRERAGYREGQSGSIGELLRAIASAPPAGDAALRAAMLRDLARSIDSFDEVHRA